MSSPVRDAFVRLHRWAGLALAGFMVVAGLTGSVIVFNHELDEWLNPELFRTTARGTPLDPLELAARVDAEELRRYVSYVPLVVEPGQALVLGLRSDADPGKEAPANTAYHEVFLDPVTGSRLGEREWGACCFSRKQLLPFLYSVHYRLHLPEIWGMRVMGTVAIVWLIDSFVGFGLTLPRRQRRPATAGAFWRRWKPAWRVRTSASASRINFDLHRASGLWMYPVLIALAVSGIALALRAEVFRPALELVADLTPDPYAHAVAATQPRSENAGISYRHVVGRARVEAATRGWAAPFDVFHVRDAGVFGVGFGDHHQAGLGVPYLYFDASDGRVLGETVPRQGTTADLVVQAMFPLHNGNLVGLPGRIAVSASGVLVALLSVTGVVIWEKKRRGRRATAARERRGRNYERRSSSAGSSDEARRAGSHAAAHATATRMQAPSR